MSRSQVSLLALLVALLPLCASASARAQTTHRPVVQAEHDPTPHYLRPFRKRPAWLGKERGFTSKLGVGLAYRQIHSVPVLGAHFSAALGSQTRFAGGFYGVAEAVIGKTDLGLFNKQFLLGFQWELPYYAWRFGTTAHGAYLGFKRASSGNYLEGLGFGGKLHVSYDLVKGDLAALYTRLRGGFEVYDEGHVYGGATLGLGVRFF